MTRRLRTAAKTIGLRRILRSQPEFRPPESGRIDILLNFPDGPINLYQVRQWYGPLEHLAKKYSVGILCFQPESARLITQETSLKVVLANGSTDYREVEHILRPKIILYPNQNYSNYRILGLTDTEHVFICHGESDKIYMASNWVKIFNYFFVAGQASRDRLRRHVRNYDVETRTIAIGRPQIDLAQPAPIKKAGERTTVLYAPTWEGGRASMSYGSVASHGVEIITALLADPRFALIYRPHPRTGIHSATFAAADDTIRRLIVEANSATETPKHLVDDTPFGWQLDFADILISDVSAVTYDWLTTGKPLLVTEPVEPDAVMPEEGFIADLPRVIDRAASSIVATIDSVLDDDKLLRKYSWWADHYYGNRAPGASLHRFETAIERVLHEHDAAMKRMNAIDRPATQDSLPGPSKTQTLCNRDIPPTRRVRQLARLLKSSSCTDEDARFAARTRIPIESGRRALIVVTAMGEPEQLGPLSARLLDLEMINRARSLTIIVSNRSAYEFLRARTGLSLVIADSATTAEEIYTSLAPLLSLHFDQSKLNLREATHRALTHVFVGTDDDMSWINNRLRLFDVLIYPETICDQTIKERLINFPATVSFIPWGPSSEAHTLTATVLSICDKLSAHPTNEKWFR